MNLGRPYVLYMYGSGTDSSWGNVQSLKYLGGMYIKAFKLATLMTSQMSLSPWYDDSSWNTLDEMAGGISNNLDEG